MVRRREPSFRLNSGVFMLGIYYCALVITLFCGCDASIQAGGSGLAAFFSGQAGSIASARYILPQNATGFTVAYWAKPVAVAGGDSDMRLMSLSAMSPRSSMLSFLATSHRSSRQTTTMSFESFKITDASGNISASSSPEWTHYSFTWNADTGLIAAYVDGRPARLDTLGNNLGTLLRFYSLQKEPLNPDCTRTTGGYVLEDSPCHFPFKYKNVEYKSCAPWSAQPFTGGAGPRKSRNQGFDFNMRWCATVPSYSNAEGSVNKKWGFCSCEDPELATVDKESFVYKGAWRAAYSGPFPMTSIDAKSVVFASNCQSLPFSVAGKTVVVTVGRTAACDEFSIASGLDASGAAMIIFKYADGVVRRLVAPSLPPPPIPVLVSDIEAAVEIPIRPGEDGVRRCSSRESSLFDKNPNSSLPLCAIEIVAARGPPFATHYAFVIPYGASIAGLQWRLYARSRFDGAWAMIDQVSPSLSAGLKGAADRTTIRQYFFSFTAPFNFSAETQIAYRLEVVGCSEGLPSTMMRISEFALFTGVNSTSHWFDSGPVIPGGTYYGTRFFPAFSMPPVNASTRVLKAFVAAVDGSDKVLTANLGTLDMEVYPSLFPVDPARFPFRSKSTLVVGQRIVGGGGRFEFSESFTGLLDDLRLYPYSISRMQAMSLYQDGVLLAANTPVSADGEVLVTDVPWSMYSFDDHSGDDSGKSSQHLQLGVNPNAIDESQLRYGDRPAIDATGPMLFLPSRIGRVIAGGEIVQPINGPKQTVYLYMKSTRFAKAPVNVTIVLQPSFGTLSQLTVSTDLTPPAIASVVYTKSTPASKWTEDSFTYQISTTTSALTARGVVRLVASVDVEPAPLLQRFFVDPTVDFPLTIGGAFSSLNEPLKVILDLSKVTQGVLSTQANCSFDLTSSSSLSFTGMVQLLYSPPLLVPGMDVLDRLRWTYEGATTHAEIQLVVRDARPVMNPFDFVGSPRRRRLGDATFASTSAPVIDDNALVIRFNSTLLGSNRGWQLIALPQFGRLFQYLGVLPSGAVRMDAIPSWQIGKELKPVTAQSLQRIFVSQVLRASSRYYALGKANQINSAVCTASSASSGGLSSTCDRWTDIGSPCCPPLAPGLQGESTFDVLEILGESDSREFRFSSKNAGHEFVELKFPYKMVAQSVLVRQRSIGRSALFRVSFAKSGFVRNFTTCGGTDHPLMANFSVDLDVEADRSRCDLGTELRSPMPTTDCITNWERDWIIAWQGSCPLTTSTVTDADDVSWTEIEIPVCSLDVPVDTVRLDFDTRNAFDWTGVDSIALVGYPASSTTLSTVISDSIGLLYVPTPGVSGIDQFVYRAASVDCRASTASAHAIPVSSTTKLFADKETISVSQENGRFDFNFDFDVGGALDYLTQRLFRNVDTFAQAKTLFAPNATVDAFIIFPYPTSSPNQTIAYQELKSGLQLNSSSISFRRSGIDAQVLVGGDVPVVAEFIVHDYMDGLQNVSATFNYAFSLSGACGQASAILGACSSQGRPYLGGQCARGADGKYQCQCRRAAETDSDIVVAGDFCQFDSLSTCFGRGYPDRKGICTCFDPQSFGADQCNKRKYNTSVADLQGELAETAKRFSFALSIMSITDVEVVTTSTAVMLMGTFDSQPYPLISLNLADELNPDNTCNGNGVPLSGPLKDADCNCDDGYYPKKSCKSKLFCTVGEYKDGSNENAVCKPCPVGFACDGIDRIPCENGTFTLQERSTKCFADCTEAGHFNSYIVRTSDTTVQCVACTQGNFCDGLVSRQCPPGTFWTNQKICIACNELSLAHYSDAPGSLSCQLCPSGTMRVPGTPGASRSECVCTEGKWNNNPRNYSITGIPCVDCPENGVCPGYEEDREATKSTNGRRMLQDSGGDLTFGNNTNGTLVVYKNARPYPEDGFWGDPEYPSEFFSCPDECVGGANFTCKNGYRGRLCSRCEEGFHNINGFCYQCPGNSVQDNAVVFFGITGIVLAFVILNHASSEVQALDIALLYAQVANLVQQFSFFFPYPVSSLQNYYAVTDFNIDFITTDCVTPQHIWTFTDSFFTQWFLVWYVGALMLVVNGLAFVYSRFREFRRKQVEDLEKQVDLHAQRRRAAKAAARQAVLRAEIRRKQTGEILEEEGEGQSGQGILTDPMISSTGSPPNSPVAESDVASPSIRRRVPLLGEISGGLFSRSLRSDELANNGPTSSFDQCTKRFLACCCCWSRRWGSTSARNVNSNVTSQQSQVFSFDGSAEIDQTDPRFKAIARWVRRTLGFPKNHEDYLSYTNGQMAVWLNLVRIVYNSVVVICLRSFFCVSLADGTSVLNAYPELECGTTEHTILVVFGVIGVIIYGLGLPAFVYLVLTWGSQKNKKADKPFYERFGFLYTGYRQRLYRWELMVLFRRGAMCLILVCADGQPYIQAIFGGTVIVGCLAAQLYHRPYLSDRINVLESIALASIFFYLLCGLVFTGLNDLYNSRQSSQDTQVFINNFSTTLSYILLVVSVLTIGVCILVFFQDLRDYFNVLVTEKSLFRKAESEDVALIRVIRSDQLKVPKADRDLGLQFMEMAQGKKRSQQQTPATAPKLGAMKKGGTARRRSSLGNISIGGGLMRGSSKTPHTLFSSIDKDGNNTLSREELFTYVRDTLGLAGESEEETRNRIDRIFRMYDIDASGAVDVREFMDMVRSEMPTAEHCELKNTIKPKYLIKWAASKGVTPLSVAMFFELDKAMRSAVADDSIVSAYRDTSKAKFFRAIADAFPFLADWLAGAKQEDVRVFGKILSELNECRDMVGSRGTFSRITVEIDRAPVIWWLVSASEKERDTFRTVFGSICGASSTSRFGFPIWQRIKSGSSVKEAQMEQEELRMMALAQSNRPRRNSTATTNSPLVPRFRLPRSATTELSSLRSTRAIPRAIPSPVPMTMNSADEHDGEKKATEEDEAGSTKAMVQPQHLHRRGSSTKVEDEEDGDEVDEAKQLADELLGNVSKGTTLTKKRSLEGKADENPDPLSKKKDGRDDDDDKVVNLV